MAWAWRNSLDGVHYSAARRRVIAALRSKRAVPVSLPCRHCLALADSRRGIDGKVPRKSVIKSRNPMNAWGLPDAGIQETMFLPACAGSCLERQ